MKFVNRKGITPVLSIVLLVMLMIGLVLGVYMFLSGTASQTQEEAQKTTTEVLTGLSTQVKIDSLWNNSGKISLQIRNTGTRTIPSSELANIVVYVDDKPATITTTGWNTTNLDPRKTRVLDLDADYAHGARVRIELAKGSSISQTIP